VVNEDDTLLHHTYLFIVSLLEEALHHSVHSMHGGFQRDRTNFHGAAAPFAVDNRIV
jgi:hypothetical protein